MKTYNGVIIGYGGMGRWHFLGICKTERIKLSGVYDINPERMKVAREEGVERLYDSLDQVLSDPSVDFIVCATPNNFHKDISIAALRAGKAVVCEKPVTMTSEELLEIMTVQKETGGFFTIHQNRRADTDYLLIKKTAESGCLGNVFSIESRVNGSRGIPEGWRQYAVAGGGMMLDWGVHLIDQLVQMYSDEKVVSVYCNMYNVAYKECDDGFKMIMKFSSGRLAMIEVGTSHYAHTPRWVVFGDRGAITIDDWDCSGSIITAKRDTTFEEDIVYTKAGPTRTMAPRHKDTVTETVLNPDDYKPSDYDIFYRNLADVFDGTAEPRVKPEEALRVMRIMEAAFRSHETGEAVLGEF